ncbi:MAG: hypothetical protein AAFX58_05350 [Pseudomonadota bacterium]
MSLHKYARLLTLLRNERRPLGQLLGEQERALRALVQHSYRNVPFYRQRLDAAGVGPDDIASAADLQRLPVLTKGELAAQPLERVLDTTAERGSLRLQTTSGSSGSPFRFYLDRRFDDYCKAQFLRPYFSTGRRLRDRVLRIRAHLREQREWFHRLRLLRESQVLCEAPAEEMAARYRETRPDIVMGYPSTLSLLAEGLAGGGPDFSRPRIVYSDSELLTPATRARIAAAFDAPVLDVFGMYETDNIAWQCRPDSGYHLAIDSVIAEVLHDGRPVSPGETGELVCTVLFNYAMPMIRYNTGDLVRLAAEPCSCGRTLPTLDLIEGRDIDRVLLPDGSSTSAMRFLSRLSDLAGTVTGYQVQQLAVNRFRVLLSTRDPLDEHTRQQVGDAIRSSHPEATIDIVATDDIPAGTTGKRRQFVSRTAGATAGVDG